jgi:hypothetical protein
MLKSKKTLLFGFLVSTLIGVAAIYNIATAQNLTMSDQQVEAIRDNCASAKSTLNQLHSSDALLRVNIGQIYESMTTKLMEQFNSRVTDNNINNSGLVAITASYTSLLDSFRSDYIIYEKQLSLAINFDCQAQPVAFYEAIATARTYRQQIHSDVVGLNQFLDKYRLAIDQFGIDNQAIIGGVK